MLQDQNQPMIHGIIWKVYSITGASHNSDSLKDIGVKETKRPSNNIERWWGAFEGTRSHDTSGKGLKIYYLPINSMLYLSLGASSGSPIRSPHFISSKANNVCS